MLKILLILFIAVPLLEIFLLIQVGSVIGGLWTIFLVVLTAVIGGVMLRQQGFATLKRVQETFARGEIPAIELLEGAMLIFSGALLLTPGFFTDTIGFLLLTPMVRRRIVIYLLNKGVIMTAGGRPPGGEHYDSRPKTLDGEYWKDDGPDR